MTTNEPPSRKSMRSICSITEDALVGPNDSKPWNMPRHVAMNGTMITAMATTRMMPVISSVLHLCSPSPEATICISAMNGAAKERAIKAMNPEDIITMRLDRYSFCLVAYAPSALYLATYFETAPGTPAAAIDSMMV